VKKLAAEDQQLQMTLAKALTHPWLAPIDNTGDTVLNNLLHSTSATLVRRYTYHGPRFYLSQPNGGKLAGPDKIGRRGECTTRAGG
jgi:hypothetical protein